MVEFINDSNVEINEPTVVTIGKFDGKHRGHQKIFQKMKEVAREGNLKTAVFTFHTPPADVISGKVQEQIYTNMERRRNLEQEGIDYIVEYPFTKEISMLDGLTFIQEILIKKMKMKAIVAGPDCAFGYKKSGDAKLLYTYAKEYGYAVYIIKKEMDEEQQEISSTFIRHLIEEGEVRRANQLLKKPYCVSGRVCIGNRLGGSVLGFPTLNIVIPKEKTIPKLGVYASRVQMQKTGEVFFGMTNVGRNPTVQEDGAHHRIRVETWLYNFHRDAYGEEITVEFLEFIRSEKKFHSLDELKEQLKNDRENVQKVLTDLCIL